MRPFLLWHLLADSVRRAPRKTAVVDDRERLTYAELDTMSDQVARALHDRGVGVGDRVGLWLPRSGRAVAAILGILKAGAAYVPLDPGSPIARIALIVEDCRLAALVSDEGRLSRLLPVLPAVPPCLVCLDPEGREPLSRPGTSLVRWEEIMAGPSEPPACHAIEADLAYILYTSGSTGRPKGVMVSHRAALTFVNWAMDYFRLTPEDRLASPAPLHFDLSIFDVFGGVGAGATIHLVPEQTAVFPYSLAAWIAAERITVWYSVPSTLIQLLLHGELASHDFEALRAVLFAGEVFPIQHLRRLQQLVPGPAYYNLYGPTETNVCTVYDVPTLPPEQTTACPIGRDCANTRTFLLDTDGRPVTEPYAPGELYVYGPSLMRGYWGLPDETRSVLLPNPLDPVDGDRVYRTGDLVFRNEAGEYVFVGRRDGMVKSRGFRIELGEIESVVHRHRDVVEAAATSLPDEQIGHRLALAVSLRAGADVRTAELFAFCREHLPGYMLPHVIERVPALPRTSTGKIDRIGLAAHFRRSDDGAN